jgi:adenylate kinase
MDRQLGVVMEKVALFGLPASGKGTLAQALSQEHGYEQLSTGDMIRRLRGEAGEVGDALRALPTGTFADDDLMIKAVMHELTLPKYAKGVVFDGFPRTLAQMKAMDQAGIVLDAAIYLKADEEALIDRAINRRVHVASGRVYNLKSAPPKSSGFDDVTSEPLTWREDDHEEVIRRRFADYWSKTHPVVIELSGRSGACAPLLTQIDGSANAQTASKQALEALATALGAHGSRKPKM